MAGTTSSTVAELYANIVADLQPFYEDAVLLPNDQFIMNKFNIAGTSGNTVQVPLTNAATNGATVGEGNSIVAAATGNFDPTGVNITLSKKGVGTDVSEESLEDGGMSVVSNAVLRNLSQGLAQATDVAGFVELKASLTPTDVGAGGANSDFTTNFVISPDALGYASKRAPTVSMFYDNDLDTHNFRATIRDGFKVVRPTFGVPVTSLAAIGSSAETLADIAQAVATLRSVNAPTMLNGFYIAFVDPALELGIASQLNSVTASAIGDLSMIGNRTLLQGIIGQAAGCEFYRTNNLPDAA